MISDHRNIYPSKVLLFGEYTIITGSQGLVLPLYHFHASFEESNTLNTADEIFRLDDFYQYLRKSEKLSEHLDLDRLYKDINGGAYLKSNIPHGYGIGSSGSLCAAIYARYTSNFERLDTYSDDELNHFRDITGLMEGFYHGKSSGLDCLVSLINRPILVKESNQYDLIEEPSLSAMGHFYLYDSGFPRKTAPLVNGFLKQYQEDTAYKEEIEKRSNLIDNLINGLITQDHHNFTNDIFTLSSFQYEYFADMIPESVKPLWLQGLETQDYCFKLCGAGGGGFFLVYAKDDIFESNRKYISIS